MSVRGYEMRYNYLKGIFKFDSFNAVQEECMSTILKSNASMVVSAPTSSGKTVLFQLAIAKGSYESDNFKCVYLAPIKSLCQQKLEDWKQKFPMLKIVELTGDTNESDNSKIKSANIIIATPQKLDYLTRSHHLNFQINILLIDEIHMISVQNRGGVLEAVITRLIMKWKNLRIIAVSATILNIRDIADWLCVQDQNIKQFGQQYRPVKVKKIVLGYRPCKNSFIFEKALNNKLDQTVKKYSEGKPCLIFCQTQKGTIAACQNLIQNIARNYIIQNDHQANSLIKSSKTVTDKTLARMISSGIAFHNAALSVEDRSIIINEFIKQNIKIICTTSTLSQGMNLPARLVIIKGTLAYRGSGKGYTQYTGIQLQQMMGRAGRVGYDTQGTALIMTENSNVNRYNKQLIKEPLQSRFFDQIKEHINIQISLRNVKTLDDVIRYIKKTFYYIRVGKSPVLYGLKDNSERDDYIEKLCRQTIKQLHHFEIISQINDQIKPLELCVELSKTSVSFSSTKHILNSISLIKNFESFLNVLCGVTQIQKFRSKLDERKCLKQLNSQNRYKLKDTIGTPTKKAFVLLQSYLSKHTINEWQLNRQAAEIVNIIKNTLFVVKNILKTKKIFLVHNYNICLLRFINKGCWNYPQQLSLHNIVPLMDKVEILKINQINTISKLKSSLNSRCFSVLCHQPDTYNDYIINYINNFSKISITSQKSQQLSVSINCEVKFDFNIKQLTILVGSGDESYTTAYCKTDEKDKQTKIYLKKYTLPVRISLIFDNIIGFDKFYVMKQEGVWQQTINFDYDNKQIQKDLKDYNLGTSNDKLYKSQKRITQVIKRGRKKREDSCQSISSLSSEQIQYPTTPKPNIYKNKLLQKLNKKSYFRNVLNKNIDIQQIILTKQTQQSLKQTNPPVYIKPCIIQDSIFDQQIKFNNFNKGIVQAPLSPNFEQYSYQKKIAQKPTIVNLPQKQPKLIQHISLTSKKPTSMLQNIKKISTQQVSKVGLTDPQKLLDQLFNNL